MSFNETRNIQISNQRDREMQAALKKGNEMRSRHFLDKKQRGESESSETGSEETAFDGNGDSENESAENYQIYRRYTDELDKERLKLELEKAKEK